MVYWLWILMRMAPLLWHWVRLQRQPSKLSPCGNGRMRILVLFLPKWTKKLIACKNSSSLIITNDNSQLQDRLVFFFGFGKIMREASNSTLHKFLPKRHSLKQFSFQTHHKQCQEQNKESLSFGISVWLWRTTLNPSKEEQLRQSTWWIIQIRSIRWKKSTLLQQFLSLKLKEDS